MDFVTFIEAPAFTRNLDDYLDDDAFSRLQAFLSERPEAGDVIPDTGGFRKLRWRDSRRGKGSRSGLRIIYYWFESDREIWLMTLYDKDEAADLSVAAKKALRTAINAERKARGTTKGEL